MPLTDRMSKVKDLREKVVIYLDHPIGEKDDTVGIYGIDVISARADNMENAGRWIRWLIEQTPFAILVPWWPFIAVADDDAFRPRLLMDQIHMIKRCSDILVQAGSHVSAHMREHEEHARRRKIPVACLVPFGPLPPRAGTKNCHKALAELARAMDE